MSSSCLFTYFHALLLFIVLNIHHINLNLYDIPLIIFRGFFVFFFFLCLCFFLQSSNISEVVRTSPFYAWTRLHILPICLLVFMRKLRSYMASTIACCRHFLRLLYLFSYGKECLFSFTLTLCHFTFTKCEQKLM